MSWRSIVIRLVVELIVASLTRNTGAGLPWPNGSIASSAKRNSGV